MLINHHLVFIELKNYFTVIANYAAISITGSATFPEKNVIIGPVTSAIVPTSLLIVVFPIIEIHLQYLKSLLTPDNLYLSMQVKAITAPIYKRGLL